MITALSAPVAEDITVVVATTAEEAMAAGAMAVEAAMAEVAGMVAEVELPVAGLVAEDAVVVATVAVVAMVAVVTANSEQIQIRHGGASAAPPCFFRPMYPWCRSGEHLVAEMIPTVSANRVLRGPSTARLAKYARRFAQDNDSEEGD